MYPVVLTEVGPRTGCRNIILSRRSMFPRGGSVRPALQRRKVMKCYNLLMESMSVRLRFAALWQDNQYRVTLVKLR